MAILAGVRRIRPADAVKYVGYVLRTVRLFRRPFWVLFGYVRREPMPGAVIELRDGLRITLSSDPLDVVTVFVVFVRLDYGQVPRGARVVDLGANIGVFSLFAAWCGADRVEAYEPSAESFVCLQRNVEINGLGDRIHPVRAAVVGRAGGRVPFPVRSSVFNAIDTASAGVEVEAVPTADLDGIVSAFPRVELLKLDCEGGEREILGRASAETMRRIDAVKLEFHGDDRKDISACLQRHGFVSRLADDDPMGRWYGWFTAAESRP